ncbi:cystathionine gamma-lyase-like [Corticium candelabrum]|uniref:cystathionine gamma-lyase-like n=1 Tax=Corticium candelabrum TaxID=121492 RepID=UPI002E261A18|nr:cystathionine gamma-lyase-like [Corticium candelabrum]
MKRLVFVFSKYRPFLCSFLRSMASSSETTFPHFATDAIHVGQEPEQWSSYAVVPVISLSTTFKQDGPANLHAGFEYSRSGNPTRNVFEKCIAACEGGKHGLATSSGLAATVLLTHLLKSGDHIVSVNDVYGGTNRYYTSIASKFNIQTSFVDCTNLDTFRASIKENTKMVWLETPTNPTLKVIDIKAISAIAHERKDILVVVDNTFLSPYFQRPLELGADVVMHSVTKYINGHSDVVMGVIVTNDDELCVRMRYLQNALGPVPSPFDCFLANRGLKTLHLRMKEHERNATAMATFLEGNPNVQEVFYPGLASHPQHEVAKRQCKGFGGMVAFRIKGDLSNAKKFLSSLKIFTLAESLGGFESLVEIPSIMTHASVSEQERKMLGITDTLIRLSVGLEERDDLIGDLDQALKASSV